MGLKPQQKSEQKKLFNALIGSWRFFLFFLFCRFCLDLKQTKAREQKKQKKPEVAVSFRTLGIACIHSWAEVSCTCDGQTDQSRAQENSKSCQHPGFDIFVIVPMGRKHAQKSVEHANQESKVVGKEHDVQKSKVYAYCRSIRPSCKAEMKWNTVSNGWDWLEGKYREQTKRFKMTGEGPTEKEEFAGAKNLFGTIIDLILWV